jgi:two-component system cell cycle response regulator
MARQLFSLIVDDSTEFREKARSIMASAGFDVSVAETGMQALQLAKEKSFSLICCSNTLPDMNGSNFCGQIRSIKGYDYASVLVLTDEDNSITLKQGILAGATDVFGKHELADLQTHVTRFVEDETRQLHGRVLLIEDSRLIQTIVLDILIELGLDVDAYASAEEAWDVFQQGDYDLVITDILLSGAMSGISLVRKIRSLPGQYGNVPVIATSGFESKSRKIELFHLGVNDFLAKPVIREEFRHRVINNVNAYQNIREIRHQQNSMYSLSMLDELTQLFNRHALKAFSAKYFSEAYRFNRHLSLAVLNVDHQKRINDEMGFSTGDRVLADLSVWLKRCVRDIDMLARWAGDEFVLILPNCTANNAYELMQRVQERLEKFKPAGMDVTVSIGIASISETDQTQHSLITLFDLADTAMHQAKIAGRNCVEIYQDLELGMAD